MDNKEMREFAIKLNVKFNYAWYRVAQNFCGSLFLRIGDFLCFAETNFCDLDRLVFLAGN